MPTLMPAQSYLKDIHPYDCVKDSLNKIEFLGDDSLGFCRFINKMNLALLNPSSQMNVVHIGGSHVQADIISNRIRRNLNDISNKPYSSRGIIFPYSVAKTNNPSNYKVTYNGVWTASRNVIEGYVDTLGVTGIAVTTNDVSAEISIDLNPSDTIAYWQFNRLRVLGYASSPAVFPVLKLRDSLCLEPEFDEFTSSYLFRMDDNYETFTIAFRQNDSIPHSFTLTGIIPENDVPGLVYHAIGVNGADVPDYLSCKNFERDLSLIKPDAMVFAIGINDTFDKDYSDSAFMAHYDSLIYKIKNVAPDCFFIFITNNDSFKKIKNGKKTLYRVNENGDNAREVFRALAEKHNGAVWDLFAIMGGLESMVKWEQEELAKKDKIHFTNKGYALLGDLFFNALMRLDIERE